MQSMEISPLFWIGFSIRPVAELREVSVDSISGEVPLSLMGRDIAGNELGPLSHCGQPYRIYSTGSSTHGVCFMTVWSLMLASDLPWL